MLAREKFLKQYQKVPVVENENIVNQTPKVSVCVTTYNHAKYIEKCLEGILNQKTNFPYELILGEDDSNDGTRDICIEYSKKYPNKIRLFLHSRANNIKVFGTPTGKFNFTNNILSARGKYLAICEGDDFWTDTNKLQKQVDFLDQNNEYSMVYSDISMIDKDNIILERDYHKKLKSMYKSGAVFWDLMKGNFINTLTVCARTSYIHGYFNKFLLEEFSYDYRLWLHMATEGKIKFFNEDFASYRVHDLGISRITNFFAKRTPLVQQSALNYYVAGNQKIDKDTLAKTLVNLIRNKHLSLKEKSPTFSILAKKPLYLVYCLNWIAKRGMKK